MVDFRESHAHLPVTRLMYGRWLRNLGRREQWKTLLNHFVETRNAELRCYRLRALHATGDTELALEGATELWLQPNSQPKACDPIFDLWRATDRFDQDVAWQRLAQSIEANERVLARYLQRFFTGDNKTAADALYRVHVSPNRVARNNSFSLDTERMRAAIRHGLSRLATRDAERAAQAWARYQKSHAFSVIDTEAIEGAIAAALAQEGQFPSAAERAKFTSESVVERLADGAVANQDWREAEYWIRQLPAAEQGELKWQYWLARALRALEPGSAEAEAIFTQLSAQRHYYGFLAASRLGLQGQLNGSLTRAPQWKQVINVAGIERSVELFAVGDDINGRREWYRALSEMSQQQQAAAGHLAQSIGLIPLSIRTANIAGARDDLTLRFPIVYEPQFRKASAAVGVDLPLLFAISRQESAFDPLAVSPANARGLMQMLPATANLIARRARLSAPDASELHDPSRNITLGSYHLGWLLDRFQGQTPLAAAAYNAGEHRVDRWIDDRTGMPMDVWVERIPFSETRNYVKNVLAFKHVYSLQLGAPTPMLGATERMVREP